MCGGGTLIPGAGVGNYASSEVGIQDLGLYSCIADQLRFKSSPHKEMALSVLVAQQCPGGEGHPVPIIVDGH